MARLENLFETAKSQLDSIAQLLDTDFSDKKRLHKAVKILKRPQATLKKKLTLKLVSGKKKTFQSFRIQYNDARGPFKGGIRFHPNVNENQMKALAFWMTVKCSIANIPYGGSKGGIVVDPSRLVLKDLERLSKMYAQFLAPYIGPWKDIPAPDVNTNSQVVSWMLESFEKRKKHHSPAAFTGKPLELGGSLGREEATGQGGVYILEKYLQKISTKKSNIKLAIQGFGNVGYWFSKLAWESGFKIVAVSDITGGIYDEKGLNIDELKKLFDKFGNLKEVSLMTKYKFIENKEILNLPVNCLVPAALEGAITKENVKNIKAKFILELANGPTTAEADVLLKSNNIDVIPDILSNSGGVIVSYYEWVQNLQGISRTKKEVNLFLKEKITKAFEDVQKITIDKKITYRQAALYLGIKRVIDAILRGRV